MYIYMQTSFAACSQQHALNPVQFKKVWRPSAWFVRAWLTSMPLYVLSP